ncbi:MAG: cobyrinate a,c-diamide synthase, partial [Chloroflexota bacterium]
YGETHAALGELFGRVASAADIAIIEGMMGLFDGRFGEGDTGSSAEVSRLLGAPVVLVLDVGKVGRSAAATALGFQRFDPTLNLAGVILNNVGSARHRETVAGPLTGATGLPVLGALPRSPDYQIPERHLGLVPDAESEDDELLARIAEAVAQHCDLDALWAIAAAAPSLQVNASGGLFPEGEAGAAGGPVRIAVARDAAFNFYYQDNLDLLAAWGAELVPFSPLADGALPGGVAGLYVGGGFPEVFAAQLAANAGARRAVAEAVVADMPVLAECGGLMYLSQAIVDFDGSRHAMAGVTPAVCVMQRRRARLGYLTVTARHDTPLLRQGEAVRAHEFHWSTLESPPDPAAAAFDVLGEPERVEGFARGNLLASYTHIHFAARPGLAARFVDSCRRWGAGP